MLGTDSKHALLWLQHPLALPLAWLAVPMGPGLWSLFCSTLTPLQEPSGSVHGWLIGWEQGIHNPARIPCLPELPAGRAALLLKGKVMVPCQHHGGLCKPSMRQGGVPNVDF